jgi:hypothetical protein
MKDDLIKALMSFDVDIDDPNFTMLVNMVLATRKPDKAIQKQRLCNALEDYSNNMLNGVFLSPSDAKTVIDLIREYHSTKKPLKLKASDLDSITDMPTTRFKLRAFKELQVATWGLSAGLYIIGADSQVGKTAILIQIALDVLWSNPDSRVHLFSLDDRILKFKQRLVSCMSYYFSNDVDMSVDSDFAFSRCTHIENAKGVVNPKIDYFRTQAIDYLKDAVNSGRLNIYDGKYTSDMMSERLEDCNKDTDIVIIDGAYRIDAGGKERMDKEERIVTYLKELSNEKLCPVFAVKEIKKGDSRGSGTDKATNQRKRSGYSGDDIRGSVLWDYEPDVQLILEKLGATDEAFTNRIRMKIDKNKIRGFETVSEHLLTYTKTIYREPK